MNKKPKHKINGQFAARTIPMLRSPAYRALCLTGHRILARLEIELAQHGGKDNGKLPVTFADFEEYGIYRRVLSPGLREVEALGFIELTQRGRSGNGWHRTPNLWRITYLPAYGNPPTDDWLKARTIEEAEMMVLGVRRVTKKTARKKPFPGATSARALVQ
jgi:hypothetical protein